MKLVDVFRRASAPAYDRDWVARFRALDGKCWRADLPNVKRLIFADLAVAPGQTQPYGLDLVCGEIIFEGLRMNAGRHLETERNA